MNLFFCFVFVFFYKFYELTCLFIQRLSISQAIWALGGGREKEGGGVEEELERKEGPFDPDIRAPESHAK